MLVKTSLFLRMAYNKILLLLDLDKTMIRMLFIGDAVKEKISAHILKETIDTCLKHESQVSKSGQSTHFWVKRINYL